MQCSLFRDFSWPPRIPQNIGANLYRDGRTFGHRETGGSWGKDDLTNPPMDARSHSPLWREGAQALTKNPGNQWNGCQHNSLSFR